MSWIHDINKIPEEGDVVKEVKFSYGDTARLFFESGKTVSLYYEDFGESKCVDEDKEEMNFEDKNK